MAAKGAPFQLQMFGHHRKDCAGKLRSIQHIDPDVENWCLSLMRLHMSFAGVREALDAFLTDRDGFAGSFLFREFLCVFVVEFANAPIDILLFHFLFVLPFDHVQKNFPAFIRRLFPRQSRRKTPPCSPNIIRPDRPHGIWREKFDASRRNQAAYRSLTTSTRN